MFKAIKEDNDLIVKNSLEIMMSKNATVVPYSLWYSGVYDFYSSEFNIREVEDVFLSLSNNESATVFSPHIFTWSCETCS